MLDVLGPAGLTTWLVLITLGASLQHHRGGLASALFLLSRPYKFTVQGIVGLVEAHSEPAIPKAVLLLDPLKALLTPDAAAVDPPLPLVQRPGAQVVAAIGTTELLGLPFLHRGMDPAAGHPSLDT